MSDLSTTYMGVSLSNPVVVAACSLSKKVDNIKKLEEAGAGAIVIKSLFEEQIMRETAALDDALEVGAESFSEVSSFYPKVEHAGPKEHLLWIERSREAVKLPLIGSLNAVTPHSWVDYARQMAETGVNGLELNVYAVEADINSSAADVEARMLDTYQAVAEAAKIPVSVKLSPFYTCTGNVISELQKRGAKAVVLFNRFLQPTIDPATESLKHPMILSSPGEMAVPLRWVSLLYGKVDLDLVANTGAHDAADVVKYLLAGASAVQMASAIIKNGIDHVTALTGGIAEWMDAKGYNSLDDFRGKVSQKEFDGNPYDFERSQYVDFLHAR